MKIKELHLRNIASIERADIDFEHDLIDPMTGEQARTFLISGNTGAGKSAILDGIAMALYKNTPRLAGVENPSRNSYTNADGENMSVNSIEQYTRLGISPKDESYSEVVFESNDGQECRARLILGIYLGRTDSDGKRRLKHNTPKWQAKIGNEDWVNVDKKTGEPIQGAIGLSFEQFGRMAMLAQGQFAAFLTGNKRERESILEQLTNTEHFSKYGEAIKSLFDQAKDNRKTVEVKLKAEQGHTMATEDVEQMTEQVKQLADQQKVMVDQSKHLEDQIALLKTYQEAQKEKESLHTQMDEHRHRFEVLSADIRYREQQLKTAATFIEEQEVWLKAHAEREEVFTQVDLVTERLKQWRNKQEEAQRNANRLEEENQKTASLEEAKTKAESALSEAKKLVDDQQKQIDTLNDQLKALHPEEMVKQMDLHRKRREAIRELQQSAERLQQDLEEAQKLKNRMNDATQYIEQQKDKLQKAKESYKLAEVQNKKAQALLQTMKMSMDDKIMELRKRLHEEHADTCPLCGQPLTDHLMDTDFAQILSPLQQHQAEAQEAYTLAHDTFIKEKGIYDRWNGEWTTLKKAVERADKTNAESTEKVKAMAQACALEGKALTEEIPMALAGIEQQLQGLQAQQQQVDGIRLQITQLQEAKKPLDQNYQLAIAHQGKCQSTLVRHLDNLKNIGVQLETTQQEIAVLDGQLHDHLDRWYGTWKEQIDETTRQLQADAKEYGDKKKNLERARSKSDQLQVLMDHIQTIQQNVVVLYPDWQTKTMEAVSYDTNDIHNEWSQYYAQVKTHAERSHVVEEILKKEYTGEDMPTLTQQKEQLAQDLQKLAEQMGGIQASLQKNMENQERLAQIHEEMQQAETRLRKWDIINKYFGGNRFRTLVQSFILRPLLNNANIYLKQITDRYELTCSEENEQLSILVLDRYNKNQVRSATVLSGGERFMISLSLSLALSSLNRPDMNVNILFIDEGFGTLDEKSLESVMATLEKLQDIAGQTNRRVGIISHREELYDRIPVKIEVKKKGEGRSVIQ